MDSDSSTEVAMLVKKIDEMEAHHKKEMEELRELVGQLQELLGQELQSDCT